MGLVTFSAVIKGRVQGVSFRSSMLDKAIEFRVRGWVRNNEDGSVEALIQGEEADVWKLLDWAGGGPPGAQVSGVVLKRLEPHQPHTDFTILR